MTIFNPLTQRILVTEPGTLVPKHSLRPPRFLALSLSAMGFMSITIATVAPLDTRTLWYNRDTDTIRRYNPLTAAWEDMTRTGWFMHILQIAFRSAEVEGIMDDADKVSFFDVSADEMKMISVSDFKANMNISGWVQWGAPITLAAPTGVVNFQDLPERFTSVLITATYTNLGGTGGTSRRAGTVRGVYPSGARCDVAYNGMPSSGFVSGDTVNQTWQFSGDLNGQTGFIFRDFYVRDGMSYSYPNRLAIPTTDRIKSMCYVVPDGEFNGVVDDWQFAVGSVFKQFVR